MLIEDGTVYWRQILKFSWLIQTTFYQKRPKKSSEIKILEKIYQWNHDCRTESIEIGISEHGTLSSDSIEKKVVATEKSGFYFTIGYNKQVK